MLALYDLTTIAMIVTRLASFVMLFAAVLVFPPKRSAGPYVVPGLVDGMFVYWFPVYV
jgi:hypothetical protein